MEIENQDFESSQEQIKKSQGPENPTIAEHLEVKERIPVNSNGFTHRPTIHQMLPVIFFIIMLVDVCILCVIINERSLKLSIGVCYTLLSSVLIVLWVRTTGIDPSDSIQMLHRQSLQKQQPFNCQLSKFYCHTCETFVSKDSFHCRKCNRCVQVFDHHCKWLNNCIGAKNYLQFLGLIVMTEILLIFHITANSLYIVHLVTIQNIFVWGFYLSVVMLVLDFVPFLANLLLVLMHASLVAQKKTTLQLIIEKRKENQIYPMKPIQYDQQNDHHDPPLKTQSTPNKSLNHKQKLPPLKKVEKIQKIERIEKGVDQERQENTVAYYKKNKVMEWSGQKKKSKSTKGVVTLTN